MLRNRRVPRSHQVGLIDTTTEGQTWAPGEEDHHTSCAGPAGTKSDANSAEGDASRLFPDLSFSHVSILSKIDDVFLVFWPLSFCPKNT